MAHPAHSARAPAGGEIRGPFLLLRDSQFPLPKNSLTYTPYSLLAAFVLTGEQGVCVDAEVFVVLKHDAVQMSAPTAAR